MARTRVADIQRDLDQAARHLKARPLLRSRYGTNELPGARDSLTCDELERLMAVACLKTRMGKIKAE